MRQAVLALSKRGRLPRTSSDIADIQEWQSALEKITVPVTDGEATEIIRWLPEDEDDCFGLAWSVVHLLESAPGWPLMDLLTNTQNPWIVHLRNAASMKEN